MTPAIQKRTRVNGKGLWRLLKQNFKTKHLALLDLIDNLLDATIQEQEGSESGEFTGRLHVYPDMDDPSDESTTTGLCIINNCIKPIRPLQQMLQVYDYSKVNSGAGDIGENGMGLKQGCAALSDLSFALVDNGSRNDIELGIIA